VQKLKRYDIAPDRGPQSRDEIAHSWWVVDMQSKRQPDWYGVNVDTVAGPFLHAGEAFDEAQRMNLQAVRPWWRRLLDSHKAG
jgi:hypothetical protein